MTDQELRNAVEDYIASPSVKGMMLIQLCVTPLLPRMSINEMDHIAGKWEETFNWRKAVFGSHSKPDFTAANVNKFLERSKHQIDYNFEANIEALAMIFEVSVAEIQPYIKECHK